MFVPGLGQPRGNSLMKGVFLTAEGQVVRLELFSDCIVQRSEDDCEGSKALPLDFYLTFELDRAQNLLVFENVRENSTVRFRTIQGQEALLSFWEQVLDPLLARRRMGEQYRFVREVGKGVSGKVNLYEEKDGSLVAVKEMRYKDLEPLILKGIEHEIRVMRLMNHQNIVKLKRVYISEEEIRTVLEYCEEGSLSSWINARKFITEKEIKLILHDILCGLQHIHSKRVIHRDLKLDNILVRRRGSGLHFLIADFGLSAWLDHERQLFNRCGTVGFIAPEILKAKSEFEIELTPKVDVFSLGCILHRSTGKLVFNSKNNKDNIQLNKQCHINFRADIYHKLGAYELRLLKAMLDPSIPSRLSVDEALRHDFLANLPPRLTSIKGFQPRLQSREKPRSNSLVKKKEGVKLYNTSLPKCNQKEKNKLDLSFVERYDSALKTEPSSTNYATKGSRLSSSILNFFLRKDK